MCEHIIAFPGGEVLTLLKTSKLTSSDTGGCHGDRGSGGREELLLLLDNHWRRWRIASGGVPGMNDTLLVVRLWDFCRGRLKNIHNNSRRKYEVSSCLGGSPPCGSTSAGASWSAIVVSGLRCCTH